VVQECKETAAKRRRQSTRLENLGIPEEELLRQQQAGLPIKNPPKKTHLKKPPKKTSKNVFFWFFGVCSNFNFL
jgi:hypothetical protein